jgi:hypothetical protein
MHSTFHVDPPLRNVLSLISGYRSAKVLFTATSLNIFEYLTKQRTYRSVARTFKLNPRATEIFLNALAGLKFLRKKSGKFVNSSAAEKFRVHQELGMV